MSSCASNFNPGRRRSTLRSRRPLTSGEVGQEGGRAHTGIWVPHQDGTYREAVSPFSHEHAATQTEMSMSMPMPPLPSALVETDETLRTAGPPRSKHRHSKSFSSILHGASELKTITRSLSISIRNKGKRSAH
ncbi:hypothetical protein FQN49_008949, partial [Arthroderma sp. PD_2]